MSWIVILVQDEEGQSAGRADATAWAEDYPHERIPVLTDARGHFADGLVGRTGFFTSAMLLNQMGEIIVQGGLQDVLDRATIRLE